MVNLKAILYIKSVVFVLVLYRVLLCAGIFYIKKGAVLFNLASEWLKKTPQNEIPGTILSGLPFNLPALYFTTSEYSLILSSNHY